MGAHPGDRAPRRAITGRALVLGVLVVLLIVVLASPLNRYFASRGDLRTASQMLRDDQRQIAELHRELQLWSDPGYIQQQARNRLQYAMPGDVVYVVVGPGQQTQIAKTSGTAPAKKDPTWNQRLWRSVQAAGAQR